MRKRVGFTIAELMIAVSVVAILAAVTIVGYNGVVQRGRTASVSAALKDARDKLKLEKFDKSTYPTTLAALAPLGIADGNGVSYQYTSNGSTYCMTATNGNVSYKIIQDGIPEVGGCPGHGVYGVTAATNVLRNPSAETSLTDYSNPNGSTLAQSATYAKNGSTSARVTLPTIASGNSGINLSANYTIPTYIKANTTYSLSAWVYVPAATVNVTLNTQGAGIATACSAASRVTAVKDAWTRISCTFTTGASGVIALYILNSGASTAGMQFYVDSAMVTEGTTLHNYADGTTTNWVWNGTAHASTSTGPPQ